MPEAIRARWEEIRLSAVGGDGFQNQLRSKIVLPSWRFASDSGLSTEPSVPLAEEAVTKPDEFLTQLEWLTTKEAESAGPFGYELGRLDRGFAFEQSIIDAAARAEGSPNTTLLGGYLRALHEVNPDRWLWSIQQLAKQREPTRFFPSVLMQSGLTDDAANVLTDLIRRDELPA